MYPLRSLALLLLLCATGVCTAAPSELAQRAKTLGVVVLGAHEVQLARVGAMVFWNNRSVVAAPDDALSESAFQEIKWQLDKEQRLVVTRVQVKPEDLPRLSEKAHDGTTGLFGSSLAALKDDLAPYRTACQCDALLVLAPSRGELSPGSNQRLDGFTWVGFSAFSDEVRRSHSVAFVMLFLVDAASGDVVDSARNALDDGSSFHAVKMAIDLWPKNMDAVGGDAWGTLVKAFALDLRISLRWPLFRLGLRPSCTLRFFEIDRPSFNNTPYPSEARQAPVAPKLPAGADPAKCD